MLDGAGIDAPLRRAERKRLDLAGKLYLAPLTTVGNLPFRCRPPALQVPGLRLLSAGRCFAIWPSKVLLDVGVNHSTEHEWHQPVLHHLGSV